MDTDMVLGIASVLVTLFFGGLSIYFYRKQDSRPRISFFNDRSFSVFHEFATRLQTIEVRYKGNPVQESVVFLSGYVVNDGRRDISTTMVETPLHCTLPPGCTWLEINVPAASKELQAAAELANAREAVFTFGLFRRAELFRVEALIQVQGEGASGLAEKIAERLQWHHRIQDLGQVATKQLPPQGAAGGASFSQDARASFVTGLFLAICYYVLSVYIELKELEFELSGTGRVPEARAFVQAPVVALVAGSLLLALFRLLEHRARTKAGGAIWTEIATLVEREPAADENPETPTGGAK